VLEKNENNKSNNTKVDGKWDFADYAYTITGIIVGILLLAPELLEVHFGINILGGSLSNAVPALADGLEYGVHNMRGIEEFRALSPMLFLSTTALVFIKDAIDARKTGGYEGSVFTHTFESLLEDAIYMTITTIMVFGAIFFGAMYISWLAGPITWILFVFIFPLVRKGRGKISEIELPWLLLLIFAVGIIAEAITRAWIAFPLSWLIICAIKFVGYIRGKIDSTDKVFSIIYYAFSIILLAVGLTLDFWLASWSAFPTGLIICWTLSNLGWFKKAKVG